MTARGKSRHGIRPSLHPGGLRCDSGTYSRYAPESRLVRRAQERSRCSRDFHHGLMTPESQNVEWKSSWRDEFLKWICGFANAQGGVLEIGRNDCGEVVGVSDVLRLLEEIPNKAQSLLGIVVDIDLKSEHGREYLQIGVKPHPNPISYRGKFHYRSGSTSQVLRGASLTRFLLERQGRTWDDGAIPGVRMRDLDGHALDDFRERASVSGRLNQNILRASDSEVIESLRLREGRHLKRAAVLLFHPEPGAFFREAYLNSPWQKSSRHSTVPASRRTALRFGHILPVCSRIAPCPAGAGTVSVLARLSPRTVKIGYFRGADIMYQDTVEGDLFSQVERAMDLLYSKYSRALISYDDVYRVETHPVPYEAMREAVTNAVIHRDYAVPVPIQIRVHDDRVAIWNAGRLPTGWSLENLTGEHASRPYNPAIADAFFGAGLIEAWGRGIRRIRQACEDAGNPVPRWRIEPGGLWVEFPFSAAYLAKDARLRRAGNQPENHQKTTRKDGQQPEKGQKTAGEVREEASGDPEDHQKRVGSARKPPETPSLYDRILALLRRQPSISRREMAATLGTTTSTVRYRLDKLRAAGKIERVGPDKGGYWKVQGGSTTDRDPSPEPGSGNAR